MSGFSVAGDRSIFAIAILPFISHQSLPSVRLTWDAKSKFVLSKEIVLLPGAGIATFAAAVGGNSGGVAAVGEAAADEDGAEMEQRWSRVAAADASAIDTQMPLQQQRRQQQQEQQQLQQRRQQQEEQQRQQRQQQRRQQQEQQQ